jgi:hypothetical protein
MDWLIGVLFPAGAGSYLFAIASTLGSGVNPASYGMCTLSKHRDIFSFTFMVINMAKQGTFISFSKSVTRSVSNS